MSSVLLPSRRRPAQRTSECVRDKVVWPATARGRGLEEDEGAVS